MKKNKPATIWLLVISGILLTILLNFKLFSFIVEQLVNNTFQQKLEEGGRYRIQFGLYLAAFQLLLFWILSLSNYLFNRMGVSAKWPGTGKVLFWIGVNLVLLLFINILERELINLFLEGTKKRIDLRYLMLTANGIVVAGSISAAYFALLLEKLSKQETEKAWLQEEKVQAELSALKEQISPHFFFNTLSSLSTVVRNEKKEVALEFIQELSNTYRYTLASNRQDLVLLKEELAFLESYLFLLKKRFGDKLVVKIEVPEDVQPAKIPPMSLQLLVENAVQHNIVTREHPLEIRFFVDDHKIVVENNLQKKKENNGLGLGLENLSNRFRLLAQQEIVIEKDQQSFRVKLPLL